VTVKEDRAKLAKVKQALAAKYTHLANTVKSKPRKATYLRLAERFLRQAEDLKRQAS
jgi:hypothetical protein